MSAAEVDLDGIWEGEATANGEADEIGIYESLRPIDLDAVLDGRHAQPVPTVLLRDDGVGLLYPGMVNGLHSDSGIGKGWLCVHLIAENARRGRRTMYLDLEDTAESIVARLRVVGLSDTDIVRSLVYLRPQVALDDVAVGHLRALVRDERIDDVVIDSLGEAFSLEGINEDKDAEVGPWYRRVARWLAESGAGVLLIDHSTKASDNPLHPSGSKRKRAAITGASYLVEARQALVKGEGGRLRLTCAKDRHGTHRRGDVVADFVMTPHDDDGARTALYAPGPSAVPGGTDVVVELAARAAVDAASAEGRPLSRNALEGLMRIKARAETKRGGIDLAVTRGLLEEDRQGQARIYLVPTSSHLVRDEGQTQTEEPRPVVPAFRRDEDEVGVEGAGPSSEQPPDGTRS